MLCHSELSEALEEYRDHKPNVYYVCKSHDSRTLCPDKYDGCQYGKNAGCNIRKPEGIATELADCVIRILDYAGHKEYDMNQYPADLESVPKSETFGDFITECHTCLTLAYRSKGLDAVWVDSFGVVPAYLHNCIRYIYAWAQDNSVDMDEAIRNKHEFNKGRSYKHGGKII